MDWQAVAEVGRADSLREHAQAVSERANAQDCAERARQAEDLDCGVLWLMRAMQQRRAAAQHDGASTISDLIADHAERVLRAVPEHPDR